jgi:hypothetical protein
LEKPGLGDVTIFTMQLENAAQGYGLWKAMLDWMRSRPKLNCDAKFEITRNLRKFGSYPLPPLVLRSSPPGGISRQSR